MADLYEQGRRLGRKIRLYTTKDPHHDHSINDNPEAWCKQDLLADILLGAVEQPYYAPNIEALEHVKSEFEKETGIEIDVDTLFEKHWLRHVTNIVCMPSAVRKAIYSVKKIKDCKNEILFLEKLQRDRKKISNAEFMESAKQYEEQNAVALHIEKAIDAHLLIIEKDAVTIYNLSYYAPIINNWNVFLFLAFFYDKINGEDNGLVISKHKMALLHASHTTKFALTPPLSQMISDGLATEIADGYIITMFSGHYCSDDTIDRAAALLWEKMNAVEPGTSKDDLLKAWCRKIILKNNHYCHIHKYVKADYKDKFNQAAVQVINKEADLEEGSEEYKKALLDYYMGHDLMTIQFVERIGDTEFPSITTDAFDTLKMVSNAQRWSTDDYLYFHQSCRGTISYLLGQIIRSYTCDSRSLDRINDLTDEIHHKPYLVWNLCFWIWNWNPEIIPGLMRNPHIASAVFATLKKIEITEDILESVPDVKFKITSASFKHLLDIFQSESATSTPQKAKAVFDCIYTLSSPQYQIKGQHSYQQRESQEIATKLSNNIKQEFANRPNQYPVYDGHIHTKDKYYPFLLKDIFGHVKNLSPDNLYNNGTLDFDYTKLSLLLFLSQLSKAVPAKDDHFRIPSYDVAFAMLDTYKKVISAMTATSIDHETRKSKEVIPIFLPAKQNIEAIDWATLYLLLEEESLSAEFLCPPNLAFILTDDKYDRHNSFIVDKLRIHLQVLIIAYKQLKSKELELRQRGVTIDNSFIRLQNAILDIAVPYSLDELPKKRIDIFNESDERPTYRDHQAELIPQLGDVSNYFPLPDREKLLKALLRTDILIRSLKLIEVMSSEYDQTYLISLLNSQDLPGELEKLRSLNDFQFLLNVLSKHSQFKDKARLVLTYWEEKIAPRNADFFFNDITATTYRTKLLLAYQANDFKEIEAIPEPNGELFLNNSRMYPRNEKDFYKALYHFKNDNPEQAYIIYNELVYRQDDDTITVALNRFAAKIKWAEMEPDLTTKNALFTEALSEWEDYQQSIPENITLDVISENLVYNKLITLNALERYDEFDSLYNGIDRIDKVKAGYFEIGVKNRVARNMKPEALALIKEASEFHKLNDGNIPSFIVDMNNLVVNSSDPEVLKNTFNSILSAKPEILVQIIPDNINDATDVETFLLNNIVFAANDMLSTINAIDKIKHEDKYSDLIILGLNGIMRMHSWHVGSARGGFSDSHKRNPGEIDFAINAKNHHQVAICEALNLNGENNFEVQKHSVKIFNYGPSKRGLYLLVYYQGPEKNYLQAWEKYKNSIQNNVEFPESYLFVKGSFDDRSDMYNNAAVRVGISIHGNAIKLHHIFININYKATT